MNPENYLLKIDKLKFLKHTVLYKWNRKDVTTAEETTWRNTIRRRSYVIFTTTKQHKKGVASHLSIRRRKRTNKEGIPDDKSSFQSGVNENGYSKVETQGNAE